MLRLAIVLPIYFAGALMAPHLTGLAELSAIGAPSDALGLRLLDLGAAIALALLLIWTTGRWGVSPGVVAFLRALRVGLLGAIVAAGWQIFCIVTGRETNPAILLLPATLLIAELVFELVDAALRREPTAS